MAWEIMTEVTQTKSALTLEYIGGESGLIMIGGLAIFNFRMIRYMRSARFKAAL